MERQRRRDRGTKGQREANLSISPPPRLSVSLHPPSSILAASLPVVEELLPLPDPWQVFRQLSGLGHVLFFDSALRHPSLGRYSFLAADPFDWIWSRGSAVHSFQSSNALQETNPFHVLASRLACWRAERHAGLPPFQGGAAGLFGYDLCHHLERLPRPRFDEFEVPDLAIGFYDWVVAFDHLLGRAWIISTGFPETDAERRSRRARQRLAEVKQQIEDGESKTEERQTERANVSAPLRLCAKLETARRGAEAQRLRAVVDVASNFDREGYLKAVRRVIDYIHAGDCFQVNLAQRLLHPASISPMELYRRLRERNAATFAGYLDLGDFVIASASPERFLCVENGTVETRPIKGTRPRGASAEEDRAHQEELLHSAKDRAENVMIVDLLRNDLGRVCRYGSIQVPALCRLETYPFVHHLVSEVRGQLRPDTGPVDLLRAAFPGGSVTGAPKIRAMQIIAELEPTARGPYCGSLGYIGFDGTMDSNILIRTFTIGRGWLQFPVGGGIVADSVPEKEYDETWHKAEGLLRALL